MVKFTAHGKGKTLVGLGITSDNVARLKNGKPIVVTAESINLPFPIEIMIMYGETLEDLKKQLEPFIGENTKISVDPLLASVPEDARTTREGQSRGKM
jgi:hypothetical protein